MRKTAILATLAGLALFVGLIVRAGAAEIVAALSTAGWSLFWVALFHLVPLSLDALGWLSLTRNHRPAFLTFLWARWVAESFNSLLPVAQVGGHILRAGLIAGRRLPMVQASATVMVDFTIGLATELLFSIIGMVLLLRYLGDTARMIGLAGLAASLILLAGFYLAQRRGIFFFVIEFVRKYISNHRKMVELGGSARSLDEQITRIYHNHLDLLICACLRMGGWLMKAAETMLALHLLGHPVSFQDAFMIESLSNAVASIIFIIPGGLGVREGSILLLGRLLGLPADIALALALVRRGREVLLGIPGFLHWLVARGPGLARKQKSFFRSKENTRKDSR
jgi:putative membrane protein